MTAGVMYGEKIFDTMSVTSRGLKSKNNNAVIIPIGIFMDTILQAINNTYEVVLLGVKFHFT